MRGFLALICLGSVFGMRVVWADTPASDVEQPRPLWELGVFGGAVRLPHYRGSDEYSIYALPLPYFLYRGEVLRTDRDGVKGVFWSTERFEHAISLGGMPPPRGDTAAREGMQKLGALGEIGSGFKIYLTNPRQANLISINAGLRAAISMDTDDYDIAWQGLHAAVNAYYRNETLLESIRVVLRFTAGVDFADDSYHDYFYGVPVEDATISRPAYSPSGGYSGCSISASLSRQITDHISVAAYCRHDNISGASYSDSPLVRRENNSTLGLALIWRIFHSEKVETNPAGHRDSGAVTEW